MDSTMFWSYVLDNIGVPLLCAIGAALVIVVKHYADKIAKSIVAKNELSAMSKKNTIRNELLTTLSEVVKAAVASNMDLSRKMKENGHKLTEEEIMELNKTVMRLVMNTLPPSLTNDDGVLLEIIGGKDKLESIIKSMMEKYVYEYKMDMLKIDTLDKK